MAKVQRVIRIDDFNAKVFRLVKSHEGLWGITIDGDELDANGNVVANVSEYVDMPAKWHKPWEKLADALEREMRIKRGLDDGTPAPTVQSLAAAKQEKSSAPKKMAKTAKPTKRKKAK